jgi:hypothetical protein
MSAAALPEQGMLKREGALHLLLFRAGLVDGFILISIFLYTTEENFHLN